MSEQTHEHDGGHAHEHVHGFDSFLDRNWQVFVIAFGVVLVSIFAQYYPTAN